MAGRVKASKLEEDLARQLDAAGLKYEREVQVLKGRKFRADFRVENPHGGLISFGPPVIDSGCVLVEVNGQGPQGRHGGYGHAESDAEKLSAMACLGYRCLVVTGKQVRSGQALAWIRCALGLEGQPEEVFSRPAPKSRQKRLQAVRKARLSGRCVTRALPERVRRAAARAEAGP